jgi:hypothetical protein
MDDIAVEGVTMVSALPEDSWLHDIRPQPATVPAAEYEALPEDVARAIEIVDGYIVVCEFCEAPPPDHQVAGRRIANPLERKAGAAVRSGRHGCLTVNSDVDLRLRDAPC